MPHILDALFVATNAPGRSAYNRVERKMSPLSSNLMSIMGHTLMQQEKLLTPTWNKTFLDLPGKFSLMFGLTLKLAAFLLLLSSLIPLNVNSLCNIWNLKIKSGSPSTSVSPNILHKLLDVSCCLATSSSYFNIFLSRFLPPPIPLSQTQNGLKAPERAAFDDHKFPSLFVLSENLNHDILPKYTIEDLQFCRMTCTVLQFSHNYLSEYEKYVHYILHLRSC